MARGTVKWFNDQKGYGFITPEDGGKDLFVFAHSDAVDDIFRFATGKDDIQIDGAAFGGAGEGRAARVTMPMMAALISNALATPQDLAPPRPPYKTL